MKIQLLLFAFALGINANAQVGINITTPWPEEELHIGGDTSNIRIEGLNAANNPNNLGVFQYI